MPSAQHPAPSAQCPAMNSDWPSGSCDLPMPKPIPRMSGAQPHQCMAVWRKGGREGGKVCPRKRRVQPAGRIETNGWHSPAHYRPEDIHDSGRALSSSGDCPLFGRFELWPVHLRGACESQEGRSQACLFALLSPRWHRGGKVPKAVEGEGTDVAGREICPFPVAPLYAFDL